MNLPKCSCGTPLQTYKHDPSCPIFELRESRDKECRDGLVSALERMLDFARQGDVRSAYLEFHDHGPRDRVDLEWRIS